MSTAITVAIAVPLVFLLLRIVLPAGARAELDATTLARLEAKHARAQRRSAAVGCGAVTVVGVLLALCLWGISSMLQSGSGPETLGVAPIMWVFPAALLAVPLTLPLVMEYERRQYGAGVARGTYLAFLAHKAGYRIVLVGKLLACTALAGGLMLAMVLACTWVQYGDGVVRLNRGLPFGGRTYSYEQIVALRARREITQSHGTRYDPGVYDIEIRLSDGCVWHNTDFGFVPKVTDLDWIRGLATQSGVPLEVTAETKQPISGESPSP
jgi:hypothetical protein